MDAGSPAPASGETRYPSIRASPELALSSCEPVQQLVVVVKARVDRLVDSSSRRSARRYVSTKPKVMYATRGCKYLLTFIVVHAEHPPAPYRRVRRRIRMGTKPGKQTGSPQAGRQGSHTTTDRQLRNWMVGCHDMLNGRPLRIRQADSESQVDSEGG